MTTLEANNAGKAVENLAKGASAAGAGESNRWAEIAVDSQQVQHSKKSEGQSAMGSSEGIRAADSAIGEAIEDALKNIEPDYRRSPDVISSIGKDQFFKRFEEKVTDEQRKQAKESLEKDLSDLIPEKDRQAMKDLHSAIIDGDLGKLQSTLKELSANPEHLKKIVDALGKQFGKTMGVDVRTDSAGNVLLYEQGGNTALSINPKTGEASVRPVETQMDGSVVLKPGEIINKSSDEVLKDIGNEITRSLTHKRFYGDIKPLLEMGQKPLGSKPNVFFYEQEQRYPRIPQELKQMRNK